MKKSISIFFLRTLRNPVFWSFIIFLVTGMTLYCIFKSDRVDTDIVAVCISSIVVIYGYFLSHFLETNRKLKEKKLEQYLGLITAIKMFLNEPGYDKIELKSQREELQKAYFASTLLISSEGYVKFRRFIEEYIKLYKGETTDNSSLVEAQSIFINALRKEFLPFDDIEFKADVIHF